MKRLSIFAAICSLFFLPSLAGATESQPDKSGAATLPGCLSGPNDEGLYTLKTAAKSVEVGGIADLSNHVGHEVTPAGSWSKSVDERDTASEKTDKGERQVTIKLQRDGAQAFVKSWKALLRCTADKTAALTLA